MFTRVKPLGWAVNEKLTSAQQNQLDIDHANAVDKNGDDFLADLVFNSGARALIASGARLAVLSGGVLEAQSGSNSNFLGGSFLTVQSGAALSVAGSLTTTGNVAISSGTFSVSAPVSLTINSQMSVNGLSFFSADTTHYDDLIMDGNSVPGSIKLRVKDAAYLDIEDTSRGRFLSGATLEMQSGSTANFSGFSNWLSGSAGIWAAGSTETHLGTVTYGSGSTVEFASGSTVNVKGAITFTPTCTAFFSFGGTTSFATTPTFFNGLTVSAGTTSITGTNTLAGTNTISGTTTLTGAGNRLKLTPRTISRFMALSSAFQTAATYNHINDRISLGSGSIVAVELRVPQNSIIEEVVVVWSGTGNVTISVHQNSVIVGGPVISTSPGTITIPVHTTALTDQATYRLSFVENASNSPVLHSVKVTFTVSEYDDG